MSVMLNAVANKTNFSVNDLWKIVQGQEEERSSTNTTDGLSTAACSEATPTSTAALSMDTTAPAAQGTISLARPVDKVDNGQQQ